MENKDIVKANVAILKEVIAELGADAPKEVIIAVLQEVGKDRRMEAMGARSAENYPYKPVGVEPATEKQIKFLEGLKVPVKAGLTKREASDLIKEKTGRE